MGRPRKYERKDCYGDMEVIDRYVPKKGAACRVVVRCKICGREKDRTENQLQLGRGTSHESCGYGLRKQHAKFCFHWYNLRTRTENPNYPHANAYKDVSSDAFKYLIDFYDTMYPAYVEACKHHAESELTLDRIDPHGDYEPSNCRWVGWDLQYSNTRKCKLKKAISPEGKVYYFRAPKHFSLEHGLNVNSVRAALNPSNKGNTLLGWKFYVLESNDYRDISDIL